MLAYYFPNYHVDPRNERWLGEGWTEWELVHNAGPRFPGHVEPRVPLLGERDESDPEVAAEEIELATRHGVDGFIFDFYWYEDGPFLEGALERGFMKAANFESIDFSIMWANHDYLDIFPSKSAVGEPPLLVSGEVQDAAFDAMSEHVVTRYFSRPNYSRVAGKPRFSIYEIGKFIKGMGGFEPAVRAIERLDALAREHGHPGIHLDVVVWGFAVLDTDADQVDVREVIERFGVGSDRLVHLAASRRCGGQEPRRPGTTCVPSRSGATRSIERACRCRSIRTSPSAGTRRPARCRRRRPLRAVIPG